MIANNDSPFLVIAGPTASGKTDIAIELALRHNGEIISADSMQVYKHLSIGTAKPDAAELRGVAYHLIDHIEPSDQYTMGRFYREATSLIEEITARSHVPIVCGGTGLYLRALIYGMTEHYVVNNDVRDILANRLAHEGLPSLYSELRNVDAESAKRIKQNDRQRILRALEVYYAEGVPFSNLHKHPMEVPLRSCTCIYLSRPRPSLYNRINRRVDQMIANGLLDEVKDYIAAGYAEDNPAIKALGYSELMAYLNGLQTLEAAVERMKKRTRNFAKRQETWFKTMPCFQKVQAEDKDPPKLASEIFRYITN